jgi:hypothetical protein
MASQWIANFKRRPGKSALVPLVLLSSGVLASVCADTEYYRPLTDGDGIRYPLALNPAVWELLGPLDPVRMAALTWPT